MGREFGIRTGQCSDEIRAGEWIAFCQWKGIWRVRFGGLENVTMDSIDVEAKVALESWMQGSRLEGDQALFLSRWARHPLPVVEWARGRKGVFAGPGELDETEVAFRQWRDETSLDEHLDFARKSVELVPDGIDREVAARQRLCLVSGLISALRLVEGIADLLSANLESLRMGTRPQPTDELVEEALVAILSYQNAWPVGLDQLVLSPSIKRTDPIEAVVDGLLGDPRMFAAENLSRAKRRLTESGADFQETFGLLSCGWVMFRRVVLELLREFQPEVRKPSTRLFETEVRLLLVQNRWRQDPRGLSCPLHVQREDTGVAGVYFDPITLGLMLLPHTLKDSSSLGPEPGQAASQSMLSSLARAANLVSRHLEQMVSEGDRFATGLERSQTQAVRLSPRMHAVRDAGQLEVLEGESGGAIFATAIYAALTETSLNALATASCALRDDGSLLLVPVNAETLKQKLQAARDDDLSYVVLESTQACEFQTVGQDIRPRPVTIHGASSLEDLLRLVSEGKAQDELNRYGFPPRDPFFRGRRGDLQTIHSTLTKISTASIQQSLQSPLGGIGKTSLAIEYGRRYCTHWTGGIFWIHCRSAGNDPPDEKWAERQLVNEVGPHIGVDPSDYGEDHEATFSAVKRALRSRQRWLLVLDNLDSSTEWEQFQDALKDVSNRRLLVTTRLDSVGSWSLGEVVQIGRLSTEDAVDLLAARRPDVQTPQNTVSVNGVIEWLGGHALGLALVGAYMVGRDGHKLSWSDYLNKLRQVPLPTVDETDDSGRPELAARFYEYRVIAVFDQLYNSLPLPEQRALQYASLLPEGHIVTKWLYDLIEHDPNVTLDERDCNGDRPSARPVAALLNATALSRRSERQCELHSILLHRLNELLDQLEMVRSHLLDHIGLLASVWASAAKDEILADPLVRGDLQILQDIMGELCASGRIDVQVVGDVWDGVVRSFDNLKLSFETVQLNGAQQNAPVAIEDASLERVIAAINAIDDENTLITIQNHLKEMRSPDNASLNCFLDVAQAKVYRKRDRPAYANSCILNCVRTLSDNPVVLNSPHGKQCWAALASEETLANDANQAVVSMVTARISNESTLPPMMLVSVHCVLAQLAASADGRAIAHECIRKAISIANDMPGATTEFKEQLATMASNYKRSS